MIDLFKILRMPEGGEGGGGGASGGEGGGAGGEGGAGGGGEGGAGGEGGGSGGGAGGGSGATGAWKASLREDLRGSPLLAKFEDTPDGLNKAIESHANLEKLLGHEKVPIPKGPDDKEGWNRFSKAMGIPDKAEGYGLPDIEVPKGLEVDKGKFAEIAHSLKFTKAQTNELWKVYNQMNVDAYTQQMAAHEKSITDTINRLKAEWGEAYNVNVELGQMVINKFSPDKEANDFITAVLSQDPRGIKFLAKIGEQFAENKIGEFQVKRFSMSPDQAREEWHKIIKDPNHPYNNDKASPSERQAAIDYVNSLIAAANRGKG